MHLREYLFIKGLTIVEFSEKIDYASPYIGRVVRGNIVPGKKLAKQIEKATNGDVTVEDLLKIDL